MGRGRVGGLTELGRGTIGTAFHLNMDEKDCTRQVRTNHGAVIDLWISGKEEKETIRKILQRIMLITEGNNIQHMPFWTTVSPKIVQIEENKSEIIAISPTNVCLYKDKLRYVCQASSELHFPGLGDYNVRIRLAGRVSHSPPSRFYVGNRLIIPCEGDQMVRIPLLKVKIACWPIGTEAPKDDLSHVWKAVEKYPAIMPISRLFASANLLVALLRPNCALIGCVSNNKEAIGVLADISSPIKSVQMRTIEAGIDAAKAWIHKGVAMEESQVVGYYYSQNPILDCEYASDTDVMLFLEDLQGNKAVIACPMSVNGAYLYRKVADIRANWLNIAAFCIEGEVYSASSYITVNVGEGSKVVLFQQGDYVVPVRNSYTGDQFPLILKSRFRKGKDLKSSFPTALPTSPTFTFTGKLMNSYTISQYSLHSPTELLLISRNNPLSLYYQVRIQLNRSPPFLSVRVYIRSTLISLKERLCELLAVDKAAARVVCNGEEVEEQRKVTEQGGDLMFLRPGEWVIRVKIENKAVFMPINSTFTVISIKEAIEAITSFTAEHMSLYLNGNQLEEEGKTMEELSIKPGNELETRFCSELEVIIMPSIGQRYSISTSSSATISTFKQHIAISKGNSCRLMYKGEELEDNRLISHYGLRTGSVVTEISPDFLNLLVKTPGQGTFLDLSVHPKTKIRKIKAKIGKMWGILQGDFDLILTKKVENEDLLKAFLFKSTILQPSISFQ